MDTFNWNSDLNTGYEAIDNQHKKLFSYVNALILANNSNEENSIQVNRTLTSLIQYTEIHFEEEEMILQKNNYPDFEKHQASHQQFTKLMKEFKSRFENGEKILPGLLEFTQEWLVIHITKEDMKALKYSIK